MKLYSWSLYYLCYCPHGANRVVERFLVCSLLVNGT